MVFVKSLKLMMREKCDKWGRQKSNLSDSEARGLKSLRTRTTEGELIVLPTDKTGSFAVMDRGSYEKAGMSHVKKDKVVGWEELRTAQRELNGHVSMLIKIFKIGQNWNHGQRVRETMLGDHKGWTQDKGGSLPQDTWLGETGA